MTRNQALAVLVPLAVIANRLLIYVGLFYNDFAVAALAVLVLVCYPVRIPRRTLQCLAALFVFMAVHSALTAMLHPELLLTLIFNFARMATALFELIAFYAFYTSIPVAEATAGLRRAAWILSLSVLVHFALLNCAGEFGRRLATLQEHELIGREYDLQTVGFLRPRGIAMEPSFAAGYLFLMASFLRLTESAGKHIVAHWVFLISALMTGSLSMLLFLPVWAYLLFRPAKKGNVVLTAMAVVLAATFLFGVASTQVSMISGRALAILQGEDYSMSLRLVPLLRTIAGTLKEAPLSGFGIGQSRLADSAGVERMALAWLPEVESERYSGIVFAEMFGDFGIPGLLAFAALLYFCALPGKRSGPAWWWLLCILLTQNCYIYRNPQLYFWCSLGIVLARSVSLRREHGPDSIRRWLSRYLSRAEAIHASGRATREGEGTGSCLGRLPTLPSCCLFPPCPAPRR
jgi:hypothetical protein